MRHTKTKKQNQASKRNWYKGLIACMYSHANTMAHSRRLTNKENAQLLKCRKLLKEVLDNWKSTL